MKQNINIVKIGGNIIDHPRRLLEFLSDFATLKGAKILVHGGGKSTTQWAQRLNIPQKMIEGRRVTDAETLKVATMVYGGLINKSVVAQLVGYGADALGLSGADGNLIQSKKRPPHPIDFGFVGDVEAINSTTLRKLLKVDFVPVICALTHDGKGQLLNTNADTLATEIAISLSSHYQVKLCYCFEKNGVLQDVNDENSRLPVLSLEKYRELKQKNRIFAGMIPKLDNAFYARENGVEEVVILRAEDLVNYEKRVESYGTRVAAR